MKSAFISTLALALATAGSLPGAMVLKTESSQSKILSGQANEVVVRITITGSELEATGTLERPDMNLGVVLDRSGSMSGLRIEQAKEAAREVVRQMTPTDILSLVSFSDDITVDVPATKVTSPAAFEAAIAEMAARGFTALHGGVEAGAKEVMKFYDENRINRVILMSDGHANRGPSGPEDLARLGAGLAQKGVSVTTIGLGDGFNEDLMTALAAASDANYYYVRDVEELPDVFARELGELKESVAREIVIRIECPPGVEPVEIIGRPEQFENQTAEIRLGMLRAGQSRSLYVRCRVEADDGDHDAKTVLQAKADYRLASGERQTPLTAEPLVLGVTAAPAEVATSVNEVVVGETVLMETAVARDQAIRMNDKGDYEQSSQYLRSQADTLQQTAAGQSDPAIRNRLTSEADTLLEEASRMEQGALAAPERKASQERSWLLRNAKEEALGDPKP